MVLNLYRAEPRFEPRLNIGQNKHLNRARLWNRPVLREVLYAIPGHPIRPPPAYPAPHGMALDKRFLRLGLVGPVLVQARAGARAWLVQVRVVLVQVQYLYWASHVWLAWCWP